MNNSSTSTIPPAAGKPAALLNFTQLIIWCTLYILIAIIAILGNVLIIVVFSKKRQLRTRTNYLIIGLAASDILVGAVTIPLWVTVVVFLQRGKSKEVDKVYEIFMPLDILSGMLSILHLMTISLERLYAIAFPIHHRTSRARNNYIALAILWIVSGGVASLYFIIPKGPKWNGTFMVYSALGFIVPFSIILVAYVSIYVIVKIRMVDSMSHMHAVQRKESRTAVTIFVLIVLFLITWLPFFSLNLVLFSCPSCGQIISDNYSILLFCKALHYSGSALNPMVYSARMPEFRRPLKTLILERRFRTASIYSQYSRKDSIVSMRSMRGRKMSDYQLNCNCRKESAVSVPSIRDRKMSDHLSPNNHRKDSMVSERSYGGRKMSDYLSPAYNPRKDSMVSVRGRMLSDAESNC